MSRKDDFKIKLDRNYNVVESHGSLYRDNVNDVIDLLQKAGEEKVISHSDASLILNLVFRKEMTKEIKTAWQATFYSAQQPQTQTMFLQLQTHRLSNVA